jgi:LmbE family N-acetylglucosaminyl deacetylase
MKLTFKNERVLAIVAHPDDAEMLCAGTLARAKADGAPIGLCVLCRGDKGQPQRHVANLAATRRREMTAAARLLGARLWLGGFPDGELADGRAQRRKLVEIYRQFRPTLLLAHAPEDYHPDHRAASALAEAASWFCASRGHRTASPAQEWVPALWWMDTLNRSGFVPGFYLDITDFVHLKHQLLACHRSQLARARDGDFSHLAELMAAQSGARGAEAGVPAAEAFRAHHAFKRARAW